MNVNFHLINVQFRFGFVCRFWAEFTLLSKEIFEEDDDGGLHLLEYVFVDNLF